LAAGDANGNLTIWEVSTGQLLKTQNGHNGEVLALAFSPDGKQLASGGTDHTIKIWSIQRDWSNRTLSGHSGNINSVAFTPGATWLISGSDDGSMRVWNVPSGELTATLVSIADSDDWMVVSPDGLFDGSSAAWNLVLWRFSKNTFVFSPVEAFFKEFYYPGLLADILAGRSPKASQDISQKDRRQPQIKLRLVGDLNPSATIAQRNVTIQLEIVEAQVDGEYSVGSGARDVRLFCNGFLVNMWPGDVLKDRGNQALKANIPLVAG